MQGWAQRDSATLAVFGIVIAIYGLFGVLGYVPFRTLNSRNLVRLRERVPLFRSCTDKKFFTVQSWLWVLLGLHIILLGVVLLVQL